MKKLQSLGAGKYICNGCQKEWTALYGLPRGWEEDGNKHYCTKCKKRKLK